MQTIRDALLKVVPGTKVVPSHGKLPRTPDADTAIKQSIHEASRLGHNYIGTEHLLLALTHSGQVSSVFSLLGVASASIRAAVLDQPWLQKVSPSDAKDSDGGGVRDDEMATAEDRVTLPVTSVPFSKLEIAIDESGMHVRPVGSPLAMLLLDEQIIQLYAILTPCMPEITARHRKRLEAEKAGIDEELKALEAAAPAPPS